jgi:hypothetical protein
MKKVIEYYNANKYQQVDHTVHEKGEILPHDYLNNVLLKDGLKGIGVHVMETGISARVIVSEL